MDNSRPSKRKRQQDNLQCLICLQPMKNPIKACSVSHYFCCECFARYTIDINWDMVEVFPGNDFVFRLLQNCPVCRKEANPAPIDPLLLSFLPRKYFDDTCGLCRFKSKSYHDNVRHTLNCEKGTQECKYCSGSFTVAEMSDHVMLDCTQLKCHVCKQSPGVDMMELKSHISLHDKCRACGIQSAGYTYEMFHRFASNVPQQ